MTSATGQQHPISLYLKIWGLLFVLSTLSYLVDYFNFHSYLRWTLILALMLMKAGLIVAFFMHMAWERLALVFAAAFVAAWWLIVYAMDRQRWYIKL